MIMHQWFCQWLADSGNSITRKGKSLIRISVYSIQEKVSFPLRKSPDVVKLPLRMVRYLRFRASVDLALSNSCSKVSFNWVEHHLCITSISPLWLFLSWAYWTRSIMEVKEVDCSQCGSFYLLDYWTLFLIMSSFDEDLHRLQRTFLSAIDTSGIIKSIGSYGPKDRADCIAS